MNDRRTSGPVIVAAPRVSDAVGSALRNAFRAAESCPTDWDACLHRIDCAERDRRH